MRIRKLMVLACTFLTLAAAPHLSAHEASLPFVLHRGYTIVVQGSIGGIKGRHFIVDTGAVPSVVDARLVRRLGLEGRPDSVNVFSRTLSSERVILPEVDVGPRHATGVKALVQDLSFIEKGLGVRIDALIGLDVLGQGNFSIDYAAQCLRFDAAMDATDVWADMTGADSPAVIEVELNGVPVRLMVDTGAKHIILFESRVQGVFAGNRVQGVKASTNMGGSVKLKEVDPPIARLGHSHLAMERVFLLETPADLSLEIDGLLGVAALRPLRVDFDYGRHAVGWKW